MKIPKLSPLVLLISISSIAYSDSWTSNELTVTSVTAYGNHDRILVYTSGGQQYTQGCGSNVWEIVPDSDTRGAKVYSTLLAALASGMKIRLFYDTDECGSWDYHKAYVVRIYSN